MASWFILPSLTEGMPVAALEAMSYNVPCILTEACNLNDFIEDQKIISKINYSLEIDSEIEWESLPQSLKINFFRIIQESVYNSQKYAQAKNVVIQTVRQTNELTLLIKDDGIGFDSSKKSAGVGFMNIQTRASISNGVMVLKSAPGEGCSLMLQFKL